jgi:hypothetical protein
MFTFCINKQHSLCSPPKSILLAATRRVFNNLNPSWSRVIFLEGYKFGVPLYFEIGVFDFDASQTGKSEGELSRMDVLSQSVITSNAASRELMRDGKFPHKVMGTALFEVGQLLGTRGNVGSKSLQTGGAVLVHIERCNTEGDTGSLSFQLRGVKLSNAQSLGRTSCPFFELYRKVDRPTGATYISVYRSNTIRSSLSPAWNAAELDLEAVCNGDMEMAMKVIVWDFRRHGKHKMMGEFETTIRGFLEAMPTSKADSDFGFRLVKPDSVKSMGKVQVVDATVTGMTGDKSSRSKPYVDENVAHRKDHKEKAMSAQSSRRPEFVDYLSGGCQISLAVAIDFTASNGDPRQPGTPHYFHPPESKEWNDYEKAIFAVGSILAKYDSDQRFPVWGFGAKYNNVVRHCFQCGSDVEVEGVQGIMDAYRGVFRTPLTMSYPTIFTEVIQTSASYARHEQVRWNVIPSLSVRISGIWLTFFFFATQEVAEEESKLSYTILLILTSGNVENMKETKKHLIEASGEPMSVVIVGIGDADFSGMEFLDEHDPDRDGGRDITKFVQFSDYKSFNALTEAVLDEIPEQLVTYFYDRKILPGKLEDYDENDLEVESADDDERTFTFLG